MLHNGVKNFLDSHLKSDFTRNVLNFTSWIEDVEMSTVVFRFKHVQFKGDFRFKQDFTLPKMEE